MTSDVDAVPAGDAGVLENVAARRFVLPGDIAVAVTVNGWITLTVELELTLMEYVALTGLTSRGDSSVMFLASIHRVKGDSG